jgi:NAD+ kinase
VVLFDLKISRVAIISKEGHSEAKVVAQDAARILLENGLKLTSFPNLHLKDVDHVPSVRDIRNARVDLVLTVSGDGTILRMLRLLDNSIPCLCVNVGGRGIMAEVKPDQVRSSIERIMRGDFLLERRIRLTASFKKHVLPPALNEVLVARQSVIRTPMFTIDFGEGAEFTQRMDGIMVSTPTGSSGHSYSYGAPFVDGSLRAFIVTPVGAITRFPTIIKNTSANLRLLANSALQLVIDGQEVFSLEANTFLNFRKHERDAVFVRFDQAGSFRQLRNLGFD